MEYRLRVVPAATEGTRVMTDDVRTFVIMIPGVTGASEIAIRRALCVSWRPNPVTHNTTVVDTADGNTHCVYTPFREFHAWAIGPAAEQDKQRSKR